ncbi:MAG: hypothetical protein EBR42_00030 [Betaproteobacteria bacterium]|nr:hypothetical protein [Betaproteobacteria bacterium]
MNLIPCTAKIINQLTARFTLGSKHWVLGILVSLSACSLVVTGYNQAPSLLIFTWVNPHFDLSAEQDKQLRLDLQALHKWHRQQQLPIYADIFQKMATLAPKELTGPQICALVDELKDTLSPLSQQLSPAIARLAIKLSPEQLQRLEKQFVKDNKDYRKEWKFDADSADQLEVQTDKGIENAERLYGRLDSKQKALVKQLAKESQFDLSKSWNERLRRQQDIMTTLERITKSQQGLSFAQQESLALLERSVLHSPDESYRSYADMRQTINCEAAAQLHKTTSTAQREAAVKTLKTYEADVRALAKATTS